MTLLLLGGASCTKDDSASYDATSQASGEVTLQLAADAGKSGIQIVEAASKGDGEGSTLNVNDFKIQILNASQKVSKAWNTYSEMPAKVRLNAANYTLKASYGNPNDAGFGLPYFEGLKPFTVSPQQLTPLSVTCALANSKVLIAYGENIKKDYSDYHVEITPANSSSTQISFTKDETRAAYFPVGKLGLKIYLTDKEGKSRTYAPDSITVAAQDCMTINVDTKALLPGELALTIVTQTATDDKPISIEIPAFMLPKEAPSFTVEGFDAESKAITYTEGVAQQPKVFVAAQGIIKSCVVGVSPNLVALGWPESFDLANLTDANKSLLKSKGLTWLETLKGEELASIDFSKVADSLASGATGAAVYAFAFNVTDNVNQSSQLSVTMTVNPPSFALGAIADKDMWATKADNVTMTLTSGNLALAKLQYQIGSGAWSDCTIANRTTSGTTITQTITNLPSQSSATAVKFRVKYNAHLSSEVSATMEAAAQLPNHDFESYCEYKSNSSQSIAQYYWYSSETATDKYWATRNVASAGQIKGAANSYTRLNTSTPVENGSGHAVKMQSAAWGSGTTTAGSASVIYNVTSGVLFLGSYTCSVKESFAVVTYKGVLQSEAMTQGMAFASRPAHLSFDYIFAPYSGESYLAYAILRNGTTEIARANATNTSAEQSSMKSVSFDFVYSNTSLKATSIEVFFSSSTNLGGKLGNEPAIQKSNVSGGPHLGSALTVDNVVLDYTF